MCFHWRYYCKRGWSIFYAKCCFQANNRIWKFFLWNLYVHVKDLCVVFFFYFFRFKFLSHFAQKSIGNPLDSSNQRFLNRVLFVIMPFQNTAMYFLEMPGRISFVTEFLGHFKHAKDFSWACVLQWFSRICGVNLFCKQKSFTKNAISLKSYIDFDS